MNDSANDLTGPGRGGEPRRVGQHIRRLVEAGDLDEALELLRDSARESAPALSKEISLLTGRFNRLRSEVRRKTRTQDSADAERGQIAEGLNELADALDAAPVAAQAGRPSRSAKARAAYLRAVRDDIEQRLEVSIHHARFIDLGIQHDPKAASLPWKLARTDSPQPFRDVGEAFEEYQRRLLLLGAPGSGKTTTLLHVALQLVEEAEQRPAAPVPLFLNLSKFPLESRLRSRLGWRRRPRGPRAADTTGTGDAAEDGERRFEQWVIDEFTERSGVKEATARKWLKWDRIALLLDGLDEVDDRYRADLARLLNDTLLRHYPFAVVVVCSRLNEYRPLQEREETRLKLPGAVTLQPLSETQIDEYLDAARATALRAALPTDQALYEMAQTPLTLSMMTLAYGGLPPASGLSPAASLTERRNELMKAYVKRMLQRKERRDLGRVFDDDPSNDVPTGEYRYDPGQVERYLGWLAVRFSVRMRTAFSLERFYTFLEEGRERDRQPLVAWAVASSRAVLVLLFALVLGAVLVPKAGGRFPGVLVPKSLTDAAYVVLMAVAAGAVSVLLATFAYPPWPPTSRLAKSAHKSAPPLAVVGGVALGMAAAGVLSAALVQIVGAGVPPAALGLIAACIGAAVMVLVWAVAEREHFIEAAAIVALTAGALTVAVFRVTRSPGPSGHAGLAVAVATVLVVGQMIILFIYVIRDDGVRTAFGVVSVVSMAVGLFVFASWVIGELGWIKPLIVLAAITAAVLLDSSTITLFIGLALSATAGGLAGGPAGAVLAATGFGFLLLILSVLYSSSRVPKNRKVLRIVNDAARRLVAVRVERSLLGGALLVVLAGVRRMPCPCRKFLRYCADALLLKRSAADVEFVHRLLRDYFAMLELQPLLEHPDEERRLEAVRDLGYQGEAALHTLEDFTRRHRDPRFRAAAVSALGTVATPEVVGIVESALVDGNPGVRVAAVGAIRNLPQEDVRRILAAACRDLNFEVLAAVIRALTFVRDDFENKNLMSKVFSEPRNATSRLLLHSALGEIRGRIWFYEEAVDMVFRNASRVDEITSWLAEFLTDPAAWVRLGSLSVLSFQKWRAGLDEQDLVHHAGELSATDPDAQVRCAAVGLLASIGGPAAVEPLRRALADPNPEVRWAAANSLGELRVRRATEALRALLADRVPMVRRAASIALQEIGTPEALAALAETPRRRRWWPAR